MQKIIDYLLENTEELENVTREINSWDGSLDHLEAYPNDEDFFGTFFSHDVMKAVRAVHFGDYNYNDEYVRFNGYGNLESFSHYEYINELTDEVEEIAELLVENHGNIYVSDELMELIDEYEEQE